MSVSNDYTSNKKYDNTMKFMDAMGNSSYGRKNADAYTSADDKLKLLNDLEGVKAAYSTDLYAGEDVSDYITQLDDAIAYWKGAYDKQVNDNIKNAYDAKIAAIDSNLKRNEEMIAKQREAAIKQAYGQYDTEKATYGRNAEQLHGMGLGNSGYSDYLNGMAYSQMVGGVQRANETADEAVRQAYYNADQAKAEATAQKEAALADEKKAYQDNLASLYAAIGNNELDATTIEKIAKTYGISADDVKDLVKTAYTTETNTAKTEFDNYISNKGNTDEYGGKTFYSADEIREKAKAAGYSDEEIEKYVRDNDKMALDYYSSLVASGNTDEDIDSLNVSDTVKTALKEKRDELIVEEEIKTALEEIKTAPTTDIIDVADKLISEGINNKVKLDKGHELYFENDLLLVQNIGKDGLTEEEVKKALVKHNRDGRLSDVDYDNLLNYLKAKTEGGVVDADKVRARLWKNILVREDERGYNVIVGDNKIKVFANDFKESSEKASELDKLSQGALVVKDKDDYYIKTITGWHKVGKTFNDEFFAFVNEKVSQNTLITPPKHTPTNTTP